MMDLGTKNGSKHFERFTDTKGVVYAVVVKHGKELMQNIEKWMIMNNLGPFLDIPLGRTGALIVPSPPTSPVSGVDLSNSRNLITHTHLCGRSDIE